MLLQDSPVSEIRLVTSNPGQGTAIIRDIVHGREVQVVEGDVIGFDEAVVIKIEEYGIRLKIGDESMKLKQLPGENTITIIQRNSGN
jgi:hypothetical protein